MFAALRNYIFAHLILITFKFGNFSDFTALFPVVLKGFS